MKYRIKNIYIHRYIARIDYKSQLVNYTYHTNIDPPIELSLRYIKYLYTSFPLTRIYYKTIPVEDEIYALSP